MELPQEVLFKRWEFFNFLFKECGRGKIVRSRYEITWPFILISLRLLMPLQSTHRSCYFFYSGLMKL